MAKERGAGAAVHIILYSDREDVREAITARLGGAVHRLSVCDSGMELLAAVKTLAADVVVLDLGTHGLAGALLVSAVRELAPGMPILAVSAVADVDARSVVQQGIPYVILAAERNGEMKALLAHAAAQRRARLAVGSR